MIPIYRENQNSLEISELASVHYAPHLHHSVEMIYITQGSMELGIDTHLYHMEQGDFAVVFPNQIHHSQVFDPAGCRSIDLLAEPVFFDSFVELMLVTQSPDPVIKKEAVPPDIPYALHYLLQNAPPGVSLPAAMPKRRAARSLPSASNISRENLREKSYAVICRSFVQIILAHALNAIPLTSRESTGQHDLVYQTVTYLAAHFHEPVTLTKMAEDLGCSPFALSRIFSRTFHCNFNQYLNDIRLDYACTMLAETDEPITTIYLDSGFQSQATFNRTFQEKYHMTPRQFRKEQSTSRV